MSRNPEAASPETPASSAGDSREPLSATSLVAEVPAEVLDTRHVAQLKGMRLPGRPSLFQELSAIFRREAPERMQKLASAVRAQDAEQVGRLAHAMVGSLSTLGARRMQQAARSLEQAAFAGDWGLIPAAHARVMECWPELEEAFGQHTKEDCA